MNLFGHPRDLWRITAADFTVRTAYQIGKTPLLPIYAAMLGAGDLLIGMIVSVSTLTGLMLKPLFGLLSDRTGRRIWLLAGLCVFAGAPFLYRFVETPEHLFALRLLHGCIVLLPDRKLLRFADHHEVGLARDRVDRTAGHRSGEDEDCQ